MSTSLNKNQKHIFFMSLALNQAKIILGNTQDNPSVGCVITKNNFVISSGHTSFGGRPHAEQNAINNSRINLNNANLYVTLEPCSHYGKTPPCINKIIKKKIGKVFFSAKDPDKRSFNKSSKKFRDSNINVTNGILLNKVNEFYKSYFLSKKDKLPFVTCKLAASKDFYTINKRKKWITNTYSRGRVHLIRSNHDCILTSSNTIKSDNPLLNCRIKGMEAMSPARIILDNKLSISLNSNVIKDSHKYKTFIFYNKFNKRKIKMFKKFNIKLFKIPINKNKDLDLKEVLIRIKKIGFSRILLESGIKLSQNFLRDNLVNNLIIFMSNKNLKDGGSGSMKKFYKTFLKNKPFTKEKVNLFDEKMISYKIK